MDRIADLWLAAAANRQRVQHPSSAGVQRYSSAVPELARSSAVAASQKSRGNRSNFCTLLGGLLESPTVGSHRSLVQKCRFPEIWKSGKAETGSLR